MVAVATRMTAMVMEMGIGLTGMGLIEVGADQPELENQLPHQSIVYRKLQALETCKQVASTTEAMQHQYKAIRQQMQV